MREVGPPVMFISGLILFVIGYQLVLVDLTCSGVLSVTTGILAFITMLSGVVLIIVGFGLATLKRKD